MTYMSLTASSIYPVESFNEVTSLKGYSLEVAARYKKRYAGRNTPVELISAAALASPMASSNDDLVYLTADQKKAFNQGLLDAGQLVSDGFMISD